jgi:23S rRNA (cytosine1962-C5)-methyltransferase
MKSQRSLPKAVITRKAAKLLKSGHVWVYADEVEKIDPVENGSLVDVFEANGTWRGTGLVSAESTIRIRLVSTNANDTFDQAWWRRKLQWAWDFRKTAMGSRALPGCEPDTNCCRLVFSEADGLPGLIIDRYESILVSQVGTVGMERARNTVYPLLLDILRQDGQDIAGVYERNDIASRDREGLPRYKGWWDEPVREHPATTSVVARENGIAYALDLEHSQKTGFFLDQKYNRRAVRELASGRRVLDCFSHVGPFGLNAAAGGAAFVRCVDISQTACDLAAANARLNNLDDRMAFTCADVFDYLAALRDRRRAREDGGPFDLVVLDPPAFTKSRAKIDHAYRGYREINEAALKLLPRGGYLATCSCSHFMTAEKLKAAVAEAAHNAGVQLRQIEERQQAPDHPVLWGVPETHYLDFFTFQVV